jgi:hypothetical protein
MSYGFKAKARELLSKTACPGCDDYPGGIEAALRAAYAAGMRAAAQQAALRLEDFAAVGRRADAIERGGES